VVRSVGPWSAGTTQIEGSIHNAYFSLIEKAEHFVYIEVSFFPILSQKIEVSM
jgi:phospholipase D1/2